MMELADAGLHSALKEPWQYHRKLWEYLIVAKGFEQTSRKVGARAIGFGVGREPLASYFASLGANVVATDGVTADTATHWIETGQYGGSLEALNERRIVNSADFAAQVAFRTVDMRRIPRDLRIGGFDFSWSCCAFEHLGSLEAGLEFFVEQMDCLRLGGWAFHTTEFNLSSNNETLSTGGVVAYRRQDIERLIARLQALGHFVLPPAWRFLRDTDQALPATEPHLTLQLGPYAVTSFLVAARKGMPR